VPKVETRGQNSKSHNHPTKNKKTPHTRKKQRTKKTPNPKNPPPQKLKDRAGRLNFFKQRLRLQEKKDSRPLVDGRGRKPKMFRTAGESASK